MAGQFIAIRGHRLARVRDDFVDETEMDVELEAHGRGLCRAPYLILPQIEVSEFSLEAVSFRHNDLLGRLINPWRYRDVS
jgi:hypothetical protein